MNSEMMEALENIEREKGISIEIMLEALANALLTAYKRMPNAAEEALVEIDMETGAIRVIARRPVCLNGVRGRRSYNQRDARCESAEDHRSFFATGR